MRSSGSALSWLFGALGVGTVLTILGSAGCAMFGGDTGIEHSGAYSVTPPREWRAQDHGDSDEAFRLPSGNLVSLTSSCNKDTKVSLSLLTKQLLIGARKISVIKQVPIEVGHKEALYSSLRASYENVAFNVETVVLTRETCIFDFTLLSPKPIPEKDIQHFLTFVKSFTYGKE